MFTRTIAFPLVLFGICCLMKQFVDGAPPPAPQYFAPLEALQESKWGSGSGSSAGTVEIDGQAAGAPVEAAGTSAAGIAAEGVDGAGVGERAYREIAEAAMASTVLVVVADAYSADVVAGSGFVVGPGLVATNWHVANQGTHGVVKLVNKEDFYAIEGVVAGDAGRDLAILKVWRLDAPAARCGDDSTLAVGDRIFAAGNPQGFEGTFSEGLVSAIREGRTELQITAPVSPGSSGGPLFDRSGQVVGVVRSHYDGGENLNFAIPVRFVKQLLATRRQSPVALAALFKPSLMSGSANGGMAIPPPPARPPAIPGSTSGSGYDDDDSEPALSASKYWSDADCGE